MKSRRMGESHRRVDLLVRIPINSDTYSENIRTVVGAERHSAGTLPGVSELRQGSPAFFACLFRSAATCPRTVRKITATQLCGLPVVIAEHAA